MLELLELRDPLEFLGLLLCFGCIFTVGIIGYVLGVFFLCWSCWSLGIRWSFWSCWCYLCNGGVAGDPGAAGVVIVWGLSCRLNMDHQIKNTGKKSANKKVK